MTRRRALGVFGLVGAGLTGLFGTLKIFGGPAPKAKIVPGTTRLVEAYGPGPRQLGEWWLPPAAPPGRLPTVVLVHGGYWRPSYDRTLEDALAADLAGRGYLVWNVDYDASDAAWPATLTDVAAAYDFLGAGHYNARVDAARIAVVGHSAGGHLALWLASRGSLPAGAVGAGLTLTPALAVPQAAVAALALGSTQGLGGGAVNALLGGSPQQVPERYAVADPLALLPSGVRTVLIHGVADDIVPISQSEAYLAKASQCVLERVPGGHFVHLDPTSRACQVLRDALAAM